jgi:hypothetical protein
MSSAEIVRGYTYADEAIREGGLPNAWTAIAELDTTRVSAAFVVGMTQRVQVEIVADRIRDAFDYDRSGFTSDPGGYLAYHGTFDEIPPAVATAAAALVANQWGGFCVFCGEGASDEAGAVVDGFHAAANCRAHYVHENPRGEK